MEVKMLAIRAIFCKVDRMLEKALGFIIGAIGIYLLVFLIVCIMHFKIAVNVHFWGVLYDQMSVLTQAALMGIYKVFLNVHKSIIRFADNLF